MGKDKLPTQLNAEYYRRKNNLIMSEQGPPRQPPGGGGVNPPPPPPAAAGGSMPQSTSRPPPPPPPTHSKPHHGGGGVFRRLAIGAKNVVGPVVGRTLRFGGTVFALVAAVNVGSYYYERHQVNQFFGPAPPGIGIGDDGDDNQDKNKDGESSSKKKPKYKKRVLLLPFDNLKIIEHRKSGDISDLQIQNVVQKTKQPTLTMEAKELVQILHAAASDPNITALHADFGEGMRHPIGYAHLSEIRNAIKVFNESHRVHREPNLSHNPVYAIMMRNGNPKISMAFGHSFSWKEYYLASAFGYVHLQARGNLNLFGVHMENVFLGGLLDRYGVKAHVFRHGEYKNAPSIFTDKKYSTTHLEQVKSMTSSLNNSILSGIQTSRALNFDNVMWQSIFDYGSLTSTNSMDIGLVDTIPPVDPVLSLLDVNKNDEMKKGWKMGKVEIVMRPKMRKASLSEEQRQLLQQQQQQQNGKSMPPDELQQQLLEHTKKMEKNQKSAMSKELQEQVLNRYLEKMEEAEKKKGGIINRKQLEEKFGLHESFTKFNATESVPLALYKQMLMKRDKIQRTQRKINDTLHGLSEKSTATSMLLSALGMKPDDDALLSKNCDKVAVVTVDGQIGSSCSYEIVRSLRMIKVDPRVKSVVLRVNSPGGSVISSEAILEEIKLLNKPVVCSMSNSAASGGYYISMNSEKIFAQPTTITGSIGVFGLKFDATNWANSYGIRGDYYPRGSHAAAMSPLTPLTQNMKGNIARTVLDIYDYFKGIVSTGRSIPLDEVEKVAAGRVWTGEQAKEVGLVDALGGLDRAISYAKKAHTKSKEVEVDHWPKRTLRLQDLPGLLTGQGLSYADIARTLILVAMGLEEYKNPASVEHLLNELSEVKFAEKPHFMMTVDETTALDMISRGESDC